MVGAADVALNAGAMFVLTVFLTAVLRYELEMSVLISGLTAISATAAGILVAVTLQVVLGIPFLWSIGVLAGIVVLSVLLYEMAS